MTIWEIISLDMSVIERPALLLAILIFWSLLLLKVLHVYLQDLLIALASSIGHLVEGFMDFSVLWLGIPLGSRSNCEIEDLNRSTEDKVHTK